MAALDKPESVPAPEGAIEKFGRQLAADIKRFDDESKTHKGIHRKSELAILTTTALTTIAAGASLLVDGARILKFVVLVLSAVGTTIVSWTASRRARDLWQHERRVYYALTDLQRELEFRLALGTLSIEGLQGLFDRSAAILGSSTAKWSRIVEQGPSPGKDAAATTDG